MGGASSPGAWCRTSSLPNDAIAHATISTNSPARSQRSARIDGPSWPARCHADAAANPAARTSPIGVAIWNPAFGPSSRTPGVASACSPRKPALASSASETRNSLASPRWLAASLVSSPSTMFTSATPSTSQKWEGWCSHRTSSSGTASSRIESGEREQQQTHEDPHACPGGAHRR